MAIEETTHITTTPVAMDSSSPLHLHLSDSPGLNLVNSTFDGREYGGWRRSILIALSTKNKVGLIDGTCKKPNADSADFKQWHRSNDMVLSWLLNSLSKEISDSVIFSKSARDLWTDLEDRFGQSNGAQLYHLQKELRDLVQGENDIAGYFTKLKILWDELDTLNANTKCGYDCSCGGKTKLTKSLQDEKLIKFLMGLNESYAAVKDERQREAFVSNHFSTRSSSFHASASTQFVANQKYERPNQFAGNQRYYAGNQSVGNQKYGNYESRTGKGKMDARRNDQFCSYCKKPGHSIEKCYRIIGFPVDFKFTKTKKGQSVQPNISSNSAIGEGSTCYSSNQGNGIFGPQLSPDLINQLIQMLNNTKGGNQETTNTEANPKIVACADSGASEHMAFDLNLFSNIIMFPILITVTLPNLQKAPSLKRPQVLGNSENGLYLLKTSDQTSKIESRNDVSISVCNKNSSVFPFSTSVSVLPNSNFNSSDRDSKPHFTAPSTGSVSHASDKPVVLLGYSNNI
ncbi:uncharacterized protein LOC132644507 [Lycium barbarum]|uniref:uncharacterized protein LOC132644507 n=1 Tax=Lycium barbarum TaxID=112863 RepID=UPI00293E75D9|nr:uncharacterized protein LOC132644507 [Lycium barbarum]